MATEGYLLDTTVASWAWDGGHRHYATTRVRLAALGDAPIFVCPITIGEVAYGLGISPAIAAGRQAEVRHAMSSEYEVLPIDHHTADVYGQIRAALFAQHAPRNRRGRLQKKLPEDLTDATTGKALGIQENDLWIVSVAIQYDLQMVTGDRAEGMRRVIVAADYLNRTEFWMP